MQTTVVMGKEKIKIITQQYVVGLYIAMYREGHAVPEQTTSKIKEKFYHKLMRKRNEWVKEESTEF